MQNTTPEERCRVQIDLSALKHNLAFLKSRMQKHQHFLMVVKADSYGHGAYEISRAAIEEGAVYLGVANPEEGKLLRIQGCKTPILILSPCLENEIPTIIDYKLSLNVSSLPFAKALNDYAGCKGQKVNIHLKVDSGMHRSGKEWTSILGFAEALMSMEHLVIEGIFSHFASSEADPEFCHLQEKRFFDEIGKLPFKPKYIHINNSAAVVNGYGQASNLVRLGILAYGVNTTAMDLPLEPVMTFHASLSQIKQIDKGETIGYNRLWKAVTKTNYGIIPIGYADGYDYLLSNNSQVLVNGRLVPVIGKISMDMITVDLGADSIDQVGDEVTLLGAGNPALKAENVVSRYRGNPYELLCQIGRRAKRYYYMGNQLLHSSPLSRRDFVPDDFGDSKLNQIIESAIAQRLQSSEIGELIYREILRSFFFQKDNDIHYRSNFKHDVFFAPSELPGFYQVTTKLTFDKILQNDYFLVACASSDEVLRKYFKRKDVEYRWLMDNAFALSPDRFLVSSVQVNDLVLDTEVSVSGDCLEIKCSHPRLKSLVGEQVSFSINTQTYYPMSAHQLSIFISELTKGVDLSFHFPELISQVECVPVFSGQDRFPHISRSKNQIRVYTKPGEWVFPISGIVFAY